MQYVHYVLLFLLLAVNSNRFLILQSYTLLLRRPFLYSATEHTFGITVLLESLLLKVRVALDRVKSRPYLGCLEETFCLCNGEIGDTNRFYKTFPLQFFNALHK